MTGWEKKIVDAFIKRYFAKAKIDSTAESLKSSKRVIRFHSIKLFPEFDEVTADEKESYLEAAEALEQKGVLKLKWERFCQGERLKHLTCENMGALFDVAGRKDPILRAGEMRAFFQERGRILENRFLSYIAEQIGPQGAGRGIDQLEAEDFARLVETIYQPEKLENITTRALSVSLFNDSKRLERLLELFRSYITRAQAEGIFQADLSFLERSFPETTFAGKILFEYKGPEPPLTNTSGILLSMPLSSLQEIAAVRPLDGKARPHVLTIENKETFYALANPWNKSRTQEEQGFRSRWDCFLYTGGFPNQASAAMLRLLAASGFCFYHAGDLDPDGILILQKIMDIAERPVFPVHMDEATFERYLLFARPLAKTHLVQIDRIREDTRSIPELPGLLRRIEETGRGVEQEIIDYR